jgi:hypothetical protein
VLTQLAVFEEQYNPTFFDLEFERMHNKTFVALAGCCHSEREVLAWLPTTLL